LFSSEVTAYLKENLQSINAERHFSPGQIKADVRENLVKD
jgi:hypothetical protein